MTACIISRDTAANNRKQMRVRPHRESWLSHLSLCFRYLEKRFRCRNVGGRDQTSSSFRVRFGPEPNSSSGSNAFSRNILEHSSDDEEFTDGSKCASSNEAAARVEVTPRLCGTGPAGASVDGDGETTLYLCCVAIASRVLER